jgi:hypothetical protein
MRYGSRASLKPIAALLTAIAIVGLTAAAGQQPQTPAPPSDEDWKPEKIENLKVLPKETTPDQIVKIMKEYAESLNAGCVLCHKGKPDAPLSTFDFADDSKEHKETTRSMIKMTNDINTKYPEGMGDDSSIETPKVTCATCHRRNRHPETDLPPKPAK